MIRVIVADDHAIVREGMMRLIDAAPDMRCVGEADSGEKALEVVETTPADVITLDLSLPGRSGLDVLLHLRTSHPNLKVLVISMLSGREHGIRVLRDGADGFLSKGARSCEILEGIRKLARGGKCIPDDIAEQLLSGQDIGSQPPHELLSAREFDILVALGRGKAPGTIAQELGLAPSTVSTYLQRIRTKIGVSSVGELIQYAVQHGIG